MFSRFSKPLARVTKPITMGGIDAYVLGGAAMGGVSGYFAGGRDHRVSGAIGGAVLGAGLGFGGSVAHGRSFGVSPKFADYMAEQGLRTGAGNPMARGLARTYGVDLLKTPAARRMSMDAARDVARSNPTRIFANRWTGGMSMPGRRG